MARTATQPDAGWVGTLDAYCADLAARGSEQHADQHRRRVLYLMAYLELSSFADITPRHAALWIAHLREHGQPHPNGRRRPCGPKTLQSHASAMNAFWYWLVQLEEVPPKASPFATLKLPRGPRTKKRAFTPDEVGRIIHAAARDEAQDHGETDDEGVPLIRSTLYWTVAVVGLRLSEAQRVRWGHLTLGTPAELLVVAHKGKNRADQRYTLPNDLAAAFIQIHSDSSGFIWPAIAQRPKAACLRLLRRDARRAGIDATDEQGRTLGWHSFRRFTATELLRAGVDVGTVQRVMRHSDAATTISHYNDVRRENIDSAQTFLGQRVAHHIPGRDTGKSGKRLEDDAEITDTTGATPDPTRSNNERGPPHRLPGVAIGRRAEARSMPAGADRGPAGGSERRHRFESCIAHSDFRDRGEAVERLLTAASDLLRAAADITRSAPEKGASDVEQQITAHERDRT